MDMEVNPRVQAEDQSKMEALQRATLKLFSDLSLEGVLRRVVSASRDLVDAEYAALGIPNEEGGLDTFITLGLSRAEYGRISHEPIGEGIIGEMIRTGQSLRIPEIKDHPKSSGFPPGHPEMHSFLGVPISAHGRQVGQIYLTDKQGAPEFTQEDLQLIETLSAHAAAAIENARLYNKVLESESVLSQRNLELEAINSLATAVSSSLELENLLQIMLTRVMQLFSADAGEIFLEEEGGGAFRKALHIGESQEAFYRVERFKLGEGYIGIAAETGRPIWTSNLAEEPKFLRRDVIEAGFQTIVCVPLTAPGRVVGVLSLAYKSERPFEDRELGLLEAVGAGVGIGVENARLYRQARRVAVLEERERIGMDLHDGIIQSIYAIGLNLDYSKILVEDGNPEVSQRLMDSISGLNDVIRDLRSYILDLQLMRIPTDDLGGALNRLVREFKANTLVDTEVLIEPEALTEVRNDSANNIFLIAQEALANVAKHAHATRVLVSLRSSSDDQITFQIIDNGRGFEVEEEPWVLGHGLSNMEERARQFGGEFEASSSRGEGTTITVRLPSI